MDEGTQKRDVVSSQRRVSHILYPSIPRAR